MTVTDWQEAYFDAVNKVETETIQQGDLVPIWNAFKAMSQEIQRLRTENERLELRWYSLNKANDRTLGEILTYAAEWMGDIEFTQFKHGIETGKHHDREG